MVPLLRTTHEKLIEHLARTTHVKLVEHLVRTTDVKLIEHLPRTNQLKVVLVPLLRTNQLKLVEHFLKMNQSTVVVCFCYPCLAAVVITMTAGCLVGAVSKWLSAGVALLSLLSSRTCLFHHASRFCHQ